MHVVKFESRAVLDEACAEFMLKYLQHKPQALFCAATGSSPAGAYHRLTARKDELNTDELRVIKVDEWKELDMTNPGSCEYYLQYNLLKPLGILTQNYIAFNSSAADSEAECKRIQQELIENGPIDLCILGIGLNGHLAFNEPADVLQPGVHLAKLSEASLKHAMVKNISGITQGYTLGMADILQSKTILLIINGPHKKDIFQQLMTRQISTQLPASLLWLHANAHCYYCED